jgi:ferredoxin-NADP reductase
MRTPATIVSIRQETPTVRSFRLDLHGHALAFLPGQWVDCYLEPDSAQVAGYSLTSSPARCDAVELAVKRVGENPVTRHLHEAARVGDTLYLDGGHGEFYYSRAMGDSLVLLAGGIGITPMMSIVRYATQCHPDVRLTLLYSAGVPAELAFRQELERLAARAQHLRVHFTVTRPEPSWNERLGHIDTAMLAEARAHAEALYFVCGPSQMIDAMRRRLARHGVADSHVRFERW